MTSPSVAIIGAGPCGLATAKALLHRPADRPFRIRLFEQGPQVGGLWPLEADARDGLMHPHMRTNLCRFTVCFSDLAWNSTDVGTSRTGAAPIYPKAWQVGRYLQQYSQKYIPDGVMSFNTKVTKANRVESGDGVKWEVTAVDVSTNEAFHDTFDFLVVASGLFTKPRNPDRTLDGFEAAQAVVPVIHSSRYRGLSDLALNGVAPKSGKIAVLGGSHSGGEIAATIALDAAATNGAHGAEPSLEVIHIAPHPMYAIPSFTQLDHESLSFAPLDLSLYELSGRKDESISFTFGKSDEGQEKAMRDMILGIMHGADPPESLPSGIPEEAKNSGTPYAIVNDKYVDFVRTGAIVPKIGRVASLTVQPNKLLSVAVSPTEKLQDVAAVVYATGFETTASLDFLDDRIKEKLSFEPNLPRMPLKVHEDLGTTTAALPDLALVGLGGAPYWGIFEMQARKVAERFAKMTETRSNSYSPSKIDGLSEELDRLRDMLRNGKPLPQNILGDYVGYMEQASRDMDLRRSDLAWKPREGIVCPARYIGSGGNASESEATMKELQTLKEQALRATHFVARAMFRSLHGIWKSNADSKGELQDGNNSPALVLNFHPRRSTGGDYDYEYVCIEDRIAGLGTNGSNPCSIWRYEESTDRILIWSTREEQNYAARNLEQYLQFQTNSPDEEKHSVLAEITEVDGGHSIFPFSNFEVTFHGVHLTQLRARDRNINFTR